MPSFVSLGELANRGEDELAVTDDWRTLSWGELDQRVSALGRGLLSLGLLEFDHVGIMVSNRIEFLESYLATIRSSFTQTPIKTNWSVEQIIHLLQDANSKAIITDTDAGRQAGKDSGVEVIDIEEDFDGWLASQDLEPLPVGGKGYRIPYTSGTTGKPKGVQRILDVELNFEDWAKQNALGAAALGLPRDGKHLMISQMFHGAPTTFAIGAFFQGAPMRIVSKWQPERFCDLLTDGATATIMVPTMFRQLLALPEAERAKINTSGLELVLHGGEQCPVTLKQKMIDWWGPIFSEYYGFTEGGMTFATSAEWLERPGTVGRPIGNMKITVVDDDKKELGKNEIGSLYFLRPEGKYFEYVNDAEKTSNAYLENGAFGVGDIGYLDEADYLFISGRTADLIVSAGVNIYPAEIEAVLFEAEGVLDAAVVAGPDSIRGEQPVAFLVINDGTKNEAETIQAVQELCRQRLANNMCPREFIIKYEIPRDPTGKTLRAQLRSELW